MESDGNGVKGEEVKRAYNTAHNSKDAVKKGLETESGNERMIEGPNEEDTCLNTLKKPWKDWRKKQGAPYPP